MAINLDHQTNTTTIATDGSIIIDKHSSAPVTPPAGSTVIYVKADGFAYSKNDSGVESSAFGSGGGGGGSQPVNQLVYGTGGGESSSANLTYVSTNGTLYINTTDGTTGSVTSATPGTVGIFGVGFTGSGTGGNITIKGGAGGSTAGGAGGVTITGGAPVEGDGGGVTIAGTDGATISASARSGGDVAITAGAPASSGTAGKIGLVTTGGYTYQRGGNFIISGDTQTNEYVLRTETVNASATEMFLDGSAGSRRMVLSDNAAWHFEIHIIGFEMAGPNVGRSAAFNSKGAIKRGSGVASTAIVALSVGTTTTADDSGATWAATVSADTSNGSLLIRVTGEAAAIVRWTAFVRTVEVLTILPFSGALFSWGSNSAGQLGDGSTLSKPIPYQVSQDSWSMISAGPGGHTMGIKTNGTLWGWGSGNSGQLGNGVDASTSSPVQIGTGTWTYVSAGWLSTAGIQTDGTLWTWGANTHGVLGQNSVISNVNSPVQIGSGTWSTVSAGSIGEHMLGIMSDGTLWAWGGNSFGQLGIGTADAGSHSSPVQVGTSSWMSVGTGNVHSVAIRSDLTMWAWGWNFYGQLGQGDFGLGTDRSFPVQVGVTDLWDTVTANCDHNAAIRDSDSTLWMWGNNSVGQLGDGTITNRSSPVQITDSWILASAGFSHTVAIKSDGTLWGWGFNTSNQLGDGTATNKSAPIQIGTSTWLSASAGGFFTEGIFDV